MLIIITLLAGFVCIHVNIGLTKNILQTRDNDTTSSHPDTTTTQHLKSYDVPLNHELVLLITLPPTRHYHATPTRATLQIATQYQMNINRKKIG